jgi:hypothetical protein
MPFHELRPPKVFIPNQSFHDYSDAKRFGELVFLTEGTQNRFKINDSYRRVSHAMRDAAPGDYLLISGPATINAIAASILAHRFGRINFLVFDGMMARYVSRPIVLATTEIQDDRSNAANRA